MKEELFEQFPFLGKGAGKSLEVETKEEIAATRKKCISLRRVGIVVGGFLLLLVIFFSVISIIDKGRTVKHIAQHTHLLPKTEKGRNTCGQIKYKDSAEVNVLGFRGLESYYDCCIGYNRTGDDQINCDVDIDECEVSNVCDQECVNTNGSYHCACVPGYRMIKKKCENINECDEGTHNCSQICTDQSPWFQCSCKSGYQSSDGGITCTDINECDQPGSCDQVCINTNGSFQCQCFPGYRMNERGCENINECDEETHNCSQICTDESPLFKCSCKSGYQTKDGGITCSDIDECQRSVKCSQDCVNTDGSYQCQCNIGYTMRYGRCEDVDECHYYYRCDSRSRCVNTYGSFHCECAEGYTMRLGSCEEVRSPPGGATAVHAGLMTLLLLLALIIILTNVLLA